MERILGAIGHLSQCINHGHGGCVCFSVGIQPILNVNPKYESIKRPWPHIHMSDPGPWGHNFNFLIKQSSLSAKTGSVRLKQEICGNSIKAEFFIAIIHDLDLHGTND